MNFNRNSNITKLMDIILCLEALEDLDAADQQDIPRRCITDRMNLSHSLHDEEFIKRFHLSKTTALNLLDTLQIQETRDGRGSPVPPHLQPLITLRWMATGSFQLTIADTFDISQQLVSNCTAKIVRAIASLLQDYVKRPSREHFSNIRNYYFEMSGFPGVLGAVDCTHIPIQSPGGARAEEFRQLVDQIQNFLTLCVVGLALFMTAEYLIIADYFLIFNMIC
ncbi:putative nuclease HARBI1 [Penaeus vannamei]|uniref:putative nuclease HARBI1 n=1 Tax=Penaeus vannamei TaxID=6689 RepID=UPI000F691C7A|nr:putative nuclease HARBI1 [Penaeus vannamei]